MTLEREIIAKSIFLMAIVPGSAQIENKIATPMGRNILSCDSQFLEGFMAIHLCIKLLFYFSDESILSFAVMKYS
jgi:hypothetical protein